jgi:hypothetical protein
LGWKQGGLQEAQLIVLLDNSSPPKSLLYWIL